jgi:hypothetical protein
MYTAQFLRRDAAAEYIKKTYGFGSYRALANGAVTGDAPNFTRLEASSSTRAKR